MRPLVTLALALGSLATLGCHHRKCEDPAPQPTTCFPAPRCYSGVIVGDACPDGVLIDVDAATPIGQAAGSLGANVVAAVNVPDFGSLNRVGQRVFFFYRNDPNQQYPLRPCPAIGTRLQVPHLVLSNLSATSCTGIGGNR
ncbi:hypothetical protein [Hymenobacter ruricola]|uniref:Uncharacterized protein n=1 Tax=Hymenobacter ruricola TaxID=2791023 RepID=A0ABS0I4S7_9BACT|nr:hypothetical protein [Hymenobacter ruricola]MBF9221948.1 hypothetical protein [Hymenobacter ruricola]